MKEYKDMAWCDHCDKEFPHSDKPCPICGAHLQRSAPSDAVSEWDWIELGRLTSDQWASTLADVLEQENIPVVILSKSGHFGTTGQMGMSSFRPIEGWYSVMVPRELAAESDSVATAILGERWEKSRLYDLNDPQ